ncbi:MAG: translocation/assembly module TamB domain-containing protein [bacterium]|nr:translocation/assembly module TamB domain-containing protein [bacterium]
MKNGARGSRRRRLVFYSSAFLLLVLVTLLVPLFAARFLGQFLHDEFMRGTGCLVSLSHPQVRFFPVRASVEDVQINCPSDIGKERESGLTARRVSAQLNLTSLLDRRVEITRLDLDDFFVQSENSDSFTRTFDFLFLPNPKKKKSDEQERWKVIVNVVSFRTPVAPSIFRYEANLYSISNAEFVGVRRPLQPDDPFEISLKSDKVEMFRSGDGQALASVRDVEAAIEINDRQFLLKELKGNGGHDLRILLKQAEFAKKGQRDFDLTIAFEGDLAELPEVVPALGSLKSYLTSSGKIVLGVKGALATEDIHFSTKLDSGLGYVFRVGRYCTASTLGFSGYYRPGQLSLSELQFGDETAKGKILYDLFRDRWGTFSVVLPFLSGKTETGNRPLRICTIDDGGSLKQRPSEPLLSEQGLPEWFPESMELFSDDSGVLKLRLILPGGQAQVLVLKPNPSTLEAEFEGSTRGQLDLSYSDGTIGLKDFTVASVRAHAVIDLLQGILPDTNYSRFYGVVADNSNLDLRVNGTVRRNGKGDYSLNSSDLTVSGGLSHVYPTYLDGMFAVDMTLGSGKGTNAIISIQTAAGRVDGELSIAVDSKVRWQVTGKALRLGELPVLRQLPIREDLLSDFSFSGTEGGAGEISGELNSYLPGAVEVTDSENTPVLQALVSGDGFTGAGHRRLKVDLENARSSLKGSLLLGEKGDKDFSLGLNVVELSYDDVRQILSRALIAPLSAEDRISAVVNYRGERDRPLLGSGKIDVSSLRVASPIGDLDVKEASILARDGRFDVDRLKLVTPAGELEVSGNFHSSGTMALVTSGDLQLFIPALGGLRSISARSHLDLGLSGSFSDPVLAGQVEVDNGSVAVADSTVPLRFDDIHASLAIDRSRLTVESLSGHIGGGQFTFKGTIEDMFAFESAQKQFNFDFHDVSLSPVAQSAFEVQGDFSYLENSDTPFKKDLKGTIRVERASYRRDIGLADFFRPVLAFVGVGYGGQEESADGRSDGGLPKDLDLDISLTAEDSLVETNLLSAELFARLNLRRDSSADDSDAELSLQGEMGVVDGKFGYKGVLFDILRGNVSFDRAGFVGEPFVDVLGETMLRDAEGDEHFIQLSVYGPLESYKIKLDSDSGLSEAEISSLMFQNAQGEGISLTKADDLDDLVTLINPFSYYNFTDRLQGFSHFSEVKVTPAFSLESGEITAFIQASRPLWGSLDIVGERDLFTGSSILRFEYPLLPYVNILLGWQSLQRVNQDSSAGSLFTGIDFHYEFFGTSIFPEEFWR